MQGPQNLSSILDIPQRRLLRLEHHQVKGFSVAATKRVAEGHLDYPEQQAAVFYALNQVVAQIQKNRTRHEPLDDLEAAICRNYATVLSQTLYSLSSYLWMIITRESRHLQSWSDWWGAYFSGSGKGSVSTRAMKYNMPMEQFDSIRQFMGTHIKGSGSNSAAAAFRDHMPDGVLAGPYCQVISDMFNTGSWGSQYGGKKWGVISDSLLRWVDGQVSGEVLVDIGFTLAHNGGPIFNKGMVYHHYNQLELLRILDVQRAGQMVEALQKSGGIAEIRAWFSAKNDGILGSTHILEQIEAYRDKFPEQFLPAVDYRKIKEAGALGNWMPKMPDKPKPPPEPEKIKIGSKMAVASGAVFSIPDGKSIYKIYERV